MNSRKGLGITSLCSREGDRIVPTCIMGELTILHEFGDGLCVVKKAGRWYKSGAYGREWLPTSILLCRVVPFVWEEHAHRMLLNSNHIKEHPLVLDQIEEAEAGRKWRMVADEMKAKAESMVS